MKLIKHNKEHHRYKGWFRELHKRPKYGIPEHVHMEMMFTSESMYRKEDVTHTGINKMFGVTFGVHGENTIGKICPSWVNSFLIGWQPAFDVNLKYPKYHSSNKIKIYSYIDYEGREIRKTIGTIPLYTRVALDIINLVNTKGILEYKIVSTDVPIASYFYVSSTPKLGYYLFPYFGGKSTAPFDIEYMLEVSVKYNNKTKFIIQ